MVPTLAEAKVLLENAHRQARAARAADKAAKALAKAKENPHLRTCTDSLNAISRCAECYFHHPESAIFKDKVSLDTLFRTAGYLTTNQWIQIDAVPAVAEEAIQWLKEQKPPAEDHWFLFYKALSKSHQLRAEIFLMRKGLDCALVIEC